MKNIFNSLSINGVFFSSQLRFSTLASWESLFDNPRILDSRDYYASQVIQENHFLRESESGHGTTGLHVLDLINRGSLKAGRSLYNRLLKICTDSKKLRQGMIVHAHVSRSEFRFDIVLNNTIVNMYAKSGYLVDARKVFDEMPVKDVVTWTTMVAGYSQNHQAEKALALFRLMLRLGLQSNQYTLSSLIKCCGESDKGTQRQRQIHAYGLKLGYESDVFVGSSLVDMYARSGMVSEARSVFAGLGSRNEVSWNALISAHAKRAEVKPALGVYWSMVREGFRATQFTYSSLCTAFARSGGSAERAKWVHTHIIKSGPRLLSFVAKTLLEIYATSGCVADAEKIFARLARSDDDVAPWNTMLGAYARHGLSEKSSETFDKMINRVGIKPNKTTFLYLLEACNRKVELMDQARTYFELMKEYHLEPEVPHYAAMVELLSRGGLEDEAREFVGQLPVEVGSRVRAMVRVKEKERACSWVEIGKSVHVFVARDHESENMDDEIRERLGGKIGCDRDAIHVHLFTARKGKGKEKDLREHSEKLATAFALLKTPLGSAIRVKKMSE